MLEQKDRQAGDVVWAALRRLWNRGWDNVLPTEVLVTLGIVAVLLVVLAWLVLSDP